MYTFFNNPFTLIFQQGQHSKQTCVCVSRYVPFNNFNVHHYRKWLKSLCATFITLASFHYTALHVTSLCLRIAALNPNRNYFKSALGSCTVHCQVLADILSAHDTTNVTCI